MERKWRGPSKSSRDDFGFLKPTRKPPSLDSLEPIPVPAATKGNQDSDWALWEDSVAFQDSQFPQDFTDSSVRVKEPATSRPAQLIDFDPFAAVTKNSG